MINSFLPTQLVQMELTMRNTDKDVIYKQVHCGILCLRCCRAVEMPTTRTAGCSNNLLPGGRSQLTYSFPLICRFPVL